MFSKGYHKSGSEDRWLPRERTPALTFLHGQNLDRFVFNLYRLLAEVRHDFFCHHSLILQYEVIRDFTNMSTCDQQACMEYIGQVGEFLNDSVYAAHDYDTGINQLFERGFVPEGPAFEHPFQAAHTHVSRGNKEFGANFQTPVKEPHDVFVPLLHSYIIVLRYDPGHTAGKLLLP